jgi:hypothetical protein
MKGPNKYKVVFTEKAQAGGKPKYSFIFGQTADSALADEGLSHSDVVGVYLIGELVQQEMLFEAETALSEGPSVEELAELSAFLNSAHGFTEGSDIGIPVEGIVGGTVEDTSTPPPSSRYRFSASSRLGCPYGKSL